MSDEYIACAALKERNGKLQYSLPRPFRHHDILLEVARPGGRDLDQGFLTNAGRFVDRREAYSIAKAAGQLIGYEPQTPGTLYTEDLW